MGRPETIEGRWDILYRDYAEVYDEFARIPKRPTAIEALNERFPLCGLRVVDVGAGSGLSTFELAQYAAFVTGVEPEESMLAIAVAGQVQRGVANVRFARGAAEDLPLPGHSADAVLGVTLSNDDVSRSAAEMERVARRGGLVLRVDVAPGWYGGELNPIITGSARDETSPSGSKDAALAARGYGAIDFFMDQDYASVDEVVRTYGFIHGKRVIEHVRAHGITSIRWKARIRHKSV